MLRNIYSCFGIVFISVFELFWKIRDFISPPSEEAVLFVAHPDDDALFFHTYINKHKPYVILLTTGELPRRIIPFFRAMRHYGVRYRCFAMKSKAVEKEALIEKRVRKILNNGHFAVCATHNATGEYGHVMHQCVHRCVRRAWEKELLVPEDAARIEQFPLGEDVLKEKMDVLNTFYQREYPTLLTFKTWIVHEKLVKIPRNTDYD